MAAKARGKGMSGLIMRHIALVETQVKRFKSLGEERLEDLRGEGHLALVQAARDWSPSAGVPFPVYAARQIRYRLIDHARHAGRRREVNIKPEAWKNRREESIDESRSAEECRAAIIDARLTEREKLVIKSIFYERMTLEEAGEAMGITRERVRQLRDKALGKIERKIERQNGETL
jgi:RNA polymerase primary sigma factor